VHKAPKLLTAEIGRGLQYDLSADVVQGESLLIYYSIRLPDESNQSS
jgi:hypothetical protein